MDAVDRILNGYVSTHNKKFDIYLIYCEFKIQFEHNYTRYLSTACVHNIEFEKIFQSLIYYIECLKINGYQFENINQITINTISDRCNMKYEYHTHPTLLGIETKLKK